MSILSSEPIDIPGKNLAASRIPTTDNKWSYRYVGARLLTYANDRWLLITDPPRSGYHSTVIALRDTDSIRVEISAPVSALPNRRIQAEMPVVADFRATGPPSVWHPFRATERRGGNHPATPHPRVDALLNRAGRRPASPHLDDVVGLVPVDLKLVAPDTDLRGEVVLGVDGDDAGSADQDVVDIAAAGADHRVHECRTRHAGGR